MLLKLLRIRRFREGISTKMLLKLWRIRRFREGKRYLGMPIIVGKR